MLNLIYLILALASAGVTVWQLGFLFGIPGAPTNPDLTITLSALMAAVIFTGLRLVGRVRREGSKQKLSID